MTWYWWKHWFWITTFALILSIQTQLILSHPIGSIDDDHIENSHTELFPSIDDIIPETEIDDVIMDNDKLTNLKLHPNHDDQQFDNIMTIQQQQHHPKTSFLITNNENIDKTFIIHNNSNSNSNIQSNNSNISSNNSSYNNNNSTLRVINTIPAGKIQFHGNQSKDYFDHIEDEPDDATDAINQNDNLDINIELNHENITQNMNLDQNSTKKLLNDETTTQSNIMQIKKIIAINSTGNLNLLSPSSSLSSSSLDENLENDFDTTTLTQDSSSTGTSTSTNNSSNKSIIDTNSNNNIENVTEIYQHDEISNNNNNNDSITKLNLITTTPYIKNQNEELLITDDINHKESSSTNKISTKLENVTKMIHDYHNNQHNNITTSNKNIEQERVRKSKELSSEYRDSSSASSSSKSINFSSETKNLLTRSTIQDTETFHRHHHDDTNVSSEALQVQRAYLMDAGTISGICFAVFAICCGITMAGIVFYRRRFLNKPQALSEPDSSGYIDDSTIRDNSDEMYSLDNDSFLNSLEAMTIQNYWTDTVKHTKL